MVLMAWYVLFMIIGDVITYFIGLAVEYEWGPEVSLIVFLSLYFFSLWIGYKLSVWVTEPKKPAIETVALSQLRQR
jgi:membrane protein implicated in regulation of membrane protease activity